ncbi:MAG: SOS response-associated peptidase [Marinovum sp.]|nr:SOS response-associated peptidase [Marinovum sp.]
MQGKAGDLLWLAAIWDVWKAPGGMELAQVASVTCAPNADVRDIHDRMGVLLHRDCLRDWLEGDQRVAKGLMVPAPKGTLTVMQNPAVDWGAP